VDVASWLRNLGLERYEAAFRKNEVGAEDLCHLTAGDLEGLGVAAIGHRRRLLVAIPAPSIRASCQICSGQLSAFSRTHPLATANATNASA
jgi:hypothetical protein